MVIDASLGSTVKLSLLSIVCGMHRAERRDERHHTTPCRLTPRYRIIGFSTFGARQLPASWTAYNAVKGRTSNSHPPTQTRLLVVSYEDHFLYIQLHTNDVSFCAATPEVENNRVGPHMARCALRSLRSQIATYGTRLTDPTAPLRGCSMWYALSPTR
jgi:hypothetical protein